MRPATLRSRLERWWRNEIRPLLILALIVFSIRSSLADWNDVPTGSMKPTILEGDRIAVNKLAYDLKVPFTTWRLAEWSNPRRGDIVVFYSPHDGVRLVKRVIGLPGETVELRAEQLLINGNLVDYKRANSRIMMELSAVDRERGFVVTEHLPEHSHAMMVIPSVPALRDFGPVVVPAGQYFLMGDNRDDSFDSRYFGMVERKRILGKALGVAFSLNRDKYWLPRLPRFFRSFDGD